MTCQGIKEALIESPAWRTIFAFIVPVLAGVLSGVFVTEITNNSQIEWSIFYKAKSFYALLALSVIMYLYNKEIYLYERELSKFLDADYCLAYMRSKCLPEAAERYKHLIRTGGGGELKQAMDELKKVLK